MHRVEAAEASAAAGSRAGGGASATTRPMHKDGFGKLRSRRRKQRVAMGLAGGGRLKKGRDGAMERRSKRTAHII